MNDHIKALFIQAGGSVEEENGNLWTYSDDLDPELFAQLVVRECVNQAHGVADLRGVNDDMVYGADTAAVRIHRYFGVEE